MLPMLLIVAHTVLAPVPATNPGVQQQVNAFLTESRWPVLYDTVERWSRLPKANRIQLVEHLIPSLTQRDSKPLKEAEGIAFGFRLQRGYLNYLGPGFDVNQDIGTTGGRAAWAIGRLLGVELPLLHHTQEFDEWEKRRAEIVKKVKKLIED